jgi:hypothetical protein
MDHRTVQAWLDRYIEAWRSNDATAIADLFDRDAEYRFHPSDEPERGPERISAAWLEEPDEPGTWDAWYRPYAVEGPRAVATGVSTYFDAGGAVDRVYDNVFVMTFGEDGRCTDFTEWFVARPGDRLDADAPAGRP